MDGHDDRSASGEGWRNLRKLGRTRNVNFAKRNEPIFTLEGLKRPHEAPRRGRQASTEGSPERHLPPLVPCAGTSAGALRTASPQDPTSNIQHPTPNTQRSRILGAAISPSASSGPLS